MTCLMGIAGKCVQRKYSTSQLQFMLNAIIFISESFVNKNSFVSCLTCLTSILDLSNLKLKIQHEKISSRLQDMTHHILFFPVYQYELVAY